MLPIKRQQQEIMGNKQIKVIFLMLYVKRAIICQPLCGKTLTLANFYKAYLTSKDTVYETNLKKQNIQRST